LVSVLLIATDMCNDQQSSSVRACGKSAGEVCSLCWALCCASCVCVCVCVWVCVCVCVCVSVERALCNVVYSATESVVRCGSSLGQLCFFSLCLWCTCVCVCVCVG